MANANTPQKIYHNLMCRKFEDYKKFKIKQVLIILTSCLGALALGLVIAVLVDWEPGGIFLIPFAVFCALNLSITYPYVARREINDAVKDAQMEFIESYGLKITDHELTNLNFPTAPNAKQKVYGTAFVTDEASGSARKVTLKGLSDKSVGLFDEKDEPLQPSKQFTNQTINSK